MQVRKCVQRLMGLNTTSANDKDDDGTRKSASIMPTCFHLVQTHIAVRIVRCSYSCKCENSHFLTLRFWWYTRVEPIQTVKSKICCRFSYSCFALAPLFMRSWSHVMLTCALSAVLHTVLRTCGIVLPGPITVFPSPTHTHSTQVYALCQREFVSAPNTDTRTK